LHRFEHGSFWPNLRESDFHYVGEGAGLGYNFNIPLNNVGMTDADYLAVFHQVLLPMANEVSNMFMYVATQESLLRPLVSQLLVKVFYYPCVTINMFPQQQ
jgi:histone deacetylase 6